MSDTVLSVRNLSVDYVGADVDFHAVKNVSFDIGQGEFFGLAGESGCGKSTIAFAISRLLRPPAIIRSGSEIVLGGRDVLALDVRAPLRERDEEAVRVEEVGVERVEIQDLPRVHRRHPRRRW